eukprot:182649-Chlamydomonas_euryale.AAC.1
MESGRGVRERGREGGSTRRVCVWGGHTECGACASTCGHRRAGGRAEAAAAGAAGHEGRAADTAQRGARSQRLLCECGWEPPHQTSDCPGLAWLVGLRRGAARS